MTERYLVVVAGAVDNIILWDGVAQWTPPAGATVIRAADAHPRVDIGWAYDGDRFYPPE